MKEGMKAGVNVGIISLTTGFLGISTSTLQGSAIRSAPVNDILTQTKAVITTVALAPDSTLISSHTISCAPASISSSLPESINPGR